MFATCSDDSTVALWDARNLKQRIRTLQGHSNWVKNIEYSPKDSLLLTSGFDGSIYTWDINRLVVTESYFGMTNSLSVNMYDRSIIIYFATCYTALQRIILFTIEFFIQMD